MVLWKYFTLGWHLGHNTDEDFCINILVYICERLSLRTTAVLRIMILRTTQGRKVRMSAMRSITKNYGLGTRNTLSKLQEILGSQNQRSVLSINERQPREVARKIKRSESSLRVV